MKRWAGVVAVGLAGLASVGSVMNANGESVSVQGNEPSWQDLVFFGDDTKSPGAKVGGVEAETKYHLAVEGGYGSGDYAIGAQVEIGADAMSAYEFWQWGGDTQYLKDPNAATTTLIMPCKNITVYARWESTSDPCCAAALPQTALLMGIGWYGLTRSRRRQ